MTIEQYIKQRAEEKEYLCVMTMICYAYPFPVVLTDNKKVIYKEWFYLTLKRDNGYEPWLSNISLKRIFSI